MLDLAHDAKDTIGEYVFSGSSGKYQAPPYEKLLVNTLDMVNYLELQDLDGARVEARRLAVMQKYMTDELHEEDNPVLGLGGLLAGLHVREERSGRRGAPLVRPGARLRRLPRRWAARCAGSCQRSSTARRA